MQRLTSHTKEERDALREKMDAPQIYSEQRCDGGGIAAGREEFETERGGAAVVRFQSGAEEDRVCVDRELLRSDVIGKNRCAVRVRVTIVDAKTVRSAMECGAGHLALRCERRLFGVHESQRWWRPRRSRWARWSRISRAAAWVTAEWSEQRRSPPQGPPPDGGRDVPGGMHGPGGPGGGTPPKPHTTDDLVFLRGVQITDARGTVEFKTIYPGHYPGRVNHIHMKVHVGGGATKPERIGCRRIPGLSCTPRDMWRTQGQLFFPEDVSRFVEATHPYSAHKD